MKLLPCYQPSVALASVPFALTLPGKLDVKRLGCKGGARGLLTLEDQGFPHIPVRLEESRYLLKARAKALESDIFHRRVVGSCTMWTPVMAQRLLHGDLDEVDTQLQKLRCALVLVGIVVAILRWNELLETSARLRLGRTFRLAVMLLFVQCLEICIVVGRHWLSMLL